MKKLLLLIFMSPLLIACSDDKGDNEKGYLTSIENVKNGIKGLWKYETGGAYYTIFNLDGTRCGGLEMGGNWEFCGKYEILKTGASYIVRLYVIGGTENDYTDWTILELTDKRMSTKSVKSNEIVNFIRVD